MITCRFEEENFKSTTSCPQSMAPTMEVPLLRSPFNNAKEITLSSTRLTWIPDAIAPECTLNIAGRIVSERIGGAFWKAAPVLPQAKFGGSFGAGFDVVVLPQDLKAARACWQQVLAGNFARHLLAILPDGHGFESLAVEIRATGATTAGSGNPHAVLDIARSVHAADACDLSILAELAGRPVLYHRNGAEVTAVPGRAAKWVAAGTEYRNPYTGATSTCAETIDLLADWQRIFSRNRNIATCAGMSLWKRRRIRQLLHTGEAALPFSRTTKAALRRAGEREGAVAVWSTRMPKGLAEAATRRDVSLHRVEDGFIRGAGLGCNLALPASITVDQRGVYFDPSRPSDLEHLISSAEFSEALILRSKRLIGLLLAGGISKYAGGGQPPALRAKQDQRIILVPGQVADDLSVQLGARGNVRDNAALLAAVRGRNPEAFIVYRPHPDVAAGHRDGAIADPVASGLADQICNDGAIAALLEQVHEVHTITSLTGFEALLRGCVVETFGQPFYASWGLTRDHAPLARRQRRISIEELVAAALILYPLYVDPQTGLPCGPEMLIARLGQSELWRPSLLMRLTRLQGQVRRTWRDARAGRKLQNA